MSLEGEPAEFIRNLAEKVNLLVFYENADYVKSLERLFLMRGLDENQPCLYVSSQPIQNIEKELDLAGFNVEYLKTKDLLKIFGNAVLNLNQANDIMVNFIKNAQKLGSHARIIIHHNDYLMPQGSMTLEDFSSTLYRQHDVSILSSYDVESILNTDLMYQLIRLHDYVMFAPSFGKGIVIKTQ
ncbi:MAG TPA: hypothetical protein VNL34_03420 [Candidatus Nitrosotenuis sp.]|nr:hypothetical protein [Candidatus Nitrosotenuis sp.]